MSSWIEADPQGGRERLPVIGGHASGACDDVVHLRDDQTASTSGPLWNRKGSGFPGPEGTTPARDARPDVLRRPSRPMGSDRALDGRPPRPGGTASAASARNEHIVDSRLARERDDDVSHTNVSEDDLRRPHRESALTSGPPTPIGTEARHDSARPEEDSRLRLPRCSGPMDQLAEDRTRCAPFVPRSTAASIGTETEHSSTPCEHDEARWRRWVSAETTDGAGGISDEARALSTGLSDRFDAQANPLTGEPNNEGPVRDAVQGINSELTRNEASEDNSIDPSAGFDNLGPHRQSHRETPPSIQNPHPALSRAATASVPDRARHAEESWMRFVFGDVRENDEDEDEGEIARQMCTPHVPDKRRQRHSRGVSHMSWPRPEMAPLRADHVEGPSRTQRPPSDAHHPWPSSRPVGKGLHGSTDASPPPESSSRMGIPQSGRQNHLRAIEKQCGQPRLIFRRPTPFGNPPARNSCGMEASFTPITASMGPAGTRRLTLGKWRGEASTSEASESIADE